MDGRGCCSRAQFALDRSASPVFRRLLDAGRLEEFHDVVNGGPTGTNLIFPNVAGVERFALVAFAGEATGDDGFDATLMNWNLEEAATRMPRRFTADTLAVLSPRTSTLTSFRRNEELEVALDIHRRLPNVRLRGRGRQPVGDRVLHALQLDTTDSDKFHRREELELGGLDARARQGLPPRGSRLRCRFTRGSLSIAMTIVSRPTRVTAGPTNTDGSPSSPGRPTSRRPTRLSRTSRATGWMPGWCALAWRHEWASGRCSHSGTSARPWRNQRSAKGALIPPRPATHEAADPRA